jgi:hypothetical protein
MYLGGPLVSVETQARPDPANDPIGRLPITLLARNVIEPIFNITDPRTDKRIDFVGGGPRPGGAGEAASYRRDGRSPSRSIRRRWTI